ncbi:glycosyltransferase [Alloalcanivorax mobilis]|uniref:glycosyltransferase n=1 Tax=Alloalcanivorax mobilis TaxID=2019569 RepID=UPI000C75C512|nr:glycosyltransferase [Alloalcanivorax mobilis]
MDVLYVIKGLGLGGAERHVVECCIAAKANGYDVCVLYFLKNKNQIEHELREKDIPVFFVKKNPWWIFSFFLFVKLIFLYRPKVVHAHLPIPALIARLFKFFFSYRMITTEHNVYGRLHPITRFLHRTLHFLDDATVSCSEAVALSLPWSTQIIDNGISVPDRPLCLGEVRHRLGIRSDAIVFICVANLLKKKNHEMLIRAFDQMIAVKSLPCHLVLVGQDGTEKPKLKSLVGQLQSADCIHFWGPHPRASNLIFDADIFCLSSDYEGLPLALLESMFVGLPSIVTKAGGMPSAVEDQMSGFVVDVANQESFSHSMAVLADNAELRKRMGQRATEIASGRFSVEAMFEKLSLIYRKDV